MSKELQIREQAPMTLMEAVMREVSNPATDPARLREFLEIGERLEALQLQRDARDAEKSYNRDFAALQKVLPVITKRGLIEYKPGTRPSPFAKWDDIHRACMPLLEEHGFAVSFSQPEDQQDGKCTVVVKITHRDGHAEKPRFTVPWLDQGGSKSPAQAASSAFTLCTRHAFCKAFNILTVEQDNDGSGKDPVAQITEEQAMKLDDLVQACENIEKGAMARWAKWIKSEFGIDSHWKLMQGTQHKQAVDRVTAKLRDLGTK